MDQLKTLLVVLATLFVAVQVDGHLHPPVKSFQKKITTDNSRNELIYALSKNSGGFNYAVCNSTNNNSYCNVTKEIPVTEDVVVKKTCHVNISNVTTRYNKILVPLNDESVLLLKYDEASNQTVNMNIYLTRLTDCRVVELTLSNLTQFGFVYTDKHVFDVFYVKELQNGSQVDCQSHLCRETYNLDGKKIRGPEQHLQRPNLGSDVIIELWIPLLVDYSRNPVSIQYSVSVGRNDTSISQRLYRASRGVGTELFNTSGFEFITVDNTNEKLSFCLKNNGSAVCKQYDSEAKLKLNLSLSLADYSSYAPDTVLLQPYNLRHHGLILLIVEMSRVENRLKVENLKVLGVSKSGRYSLPLEISYGKRNVTCSRGILQTLPIQPTLNVVEDGPEVCLQLLCPDSVPQVVGYSSVCLTKGHLDSIMDFD